MAAEPVGTHCPICPFGIPFAKIANRIGQCPYIGIMMCYPAIRIIKFLCRFPPGYRNIFYEANSVAAPSRLNYLLLPASKFICRLMLVV
jgi:hypothetical protein